MYHSYNRTVYTDYIFIALFSRVHRFDVSLAVRLRCTIELRVRISWVRVVKHYVPKSTEHYVGISEQRTQHRHLTTSKTILFVQTSLQLCVSLWWHAIWQYVAADSISYCTIILVGSTSCLVSFPGYPNANAVLCIVICWHSNAFKFEGGISRQELTAKSRKSIILSRSERQTFVNWKRWMKIAGRRPALPSHQQNVTFCDSI